MEILRKHKMVELNKNSMTLKLTVKVTVRERNLKICLLYERLNKEIKNVGKLRK